MWCRPAAHLCFSVLRARFVSCAQSIVWSSSLGAGSTSARAPATRVTTRTGSRSCAQSVSTTGYWTKHTYDVLNDLLTVSQNAQGTAQTRTYAYDGLGRMTSEQNPETNQSTYAYTFDTDSTCGTHDGDLVKRIDPQGTVTCYAYDPLHRLTSATYPSGGYSSVTPAKYYVYDSATVDSASMTYAKSRLAEAYTGSSKTTDLGFSYSNRGEVAGVYQSSPHSGGYYHIAATYWAPRGLLNLLTPNMGSNIPNWTYNPDGEGRVNTVNSSIGTQQNPVTASSYNGFSEPTAVTFGSSDSDAFQYDANTGRMTQYKATINGSAVSGTLTWNANWTLKQVVTVDPYNAGNNNKTCGYTYDDLARLTQADCGSGNWGQNFSYLDNVTNNIASFGNISKTVISGRIGQSFSATYSDTTNRLTTSGVTYDSNGNLTYDGFYNYTWDGEGNLATLGGNAETYDALDRRVEQYNGSAYTEIVYGPAGNKMALMSGQTVTKVFAPLSAGATAVYNSSGLSYYRHPDWLGSSRVASTTSRTLYYDGAYAPFGENYAETGTTDRSFTGQNQDLTPGSSGLLYDFPYREMHNIQGRWLSPDPAGINAAAPTIPQSWNRYSYVMNDPLRFVDPTGMACVYSGRGDISDPSNYYDDNSGGQTCADAFASASETVNVFGGPNAAVQEVQDVVTAFLTGEASVEVIYGPQDPFVLDFQKSAGMDAILSGITSKCGQSGGRVDVGTGEAFVNTVIDGIFGGAGFRTPEAQLGAFESTYNRACGLVEITVTNPISQNSLFYHIPGNLGIQNPQSGPLKTVNQTLQITAMDPCVGSPIQ